MEMPQIIINLILDWFVLIVIVNPIRSVLKIMAKVESHWDCRNMDRSEFESCEKTIRKQQVEPILGK
jgi:hypothetical protein